MYWTVKTVSIDVFGLKFRANISTFSELFEKNTQKFLLPSKITVMLEILNIDFQPLLGFPHP